MSVGLLQFVEDLQVNCEDWEKGCPVLCDRDFCESYDWVRCIS